MASRSVLDLGDEIQLAQLVEPDELSSGLQIADADGVLLDLAEPDRIRAGLRDRPGLRVEVSAEDGSLASRCDCGSEALCRHAVAALAAARLAGGSTLELEIKGLQRGARVYRPARLSARPGLVLVLHGAVASALNAARVSRFDRQAERRGWVVAYPQAHHPSVIGGWDSFACCPQPGVDDQAFIAELIARLQADHGLEPDRSFVTGFSRGGMMAHRLGCQLSEKVAGIAPVAGNLGDSGGRIDHEAWRPARPVPVMVVHGSADLNVPIPGGPSPLYPKQIPYAALDDVMAAWCGWNGCDPAPVRVRRRAPVLERSWSGGGSPVELRLVEGGEHTWPGPVNPPHSPDAGFDASAAIADFFAAL